MVSGTAGDTQFLPVSTDLIHHLLHMSTIGARQHPQQGPLLYQQVSLSDGDQ
jgi:hypothetical protein